MIICFSGTPGSGKTYDTVRKILDNLKLGRTIYTNVDGLDQPVCREFIKVYTGLDDYQIATQLVFLTPDKLIRFWEKDTVVKNAGTEFESRSEELICRKGSLIVIDEVHKYFNCRNWQSKENKEFADWASTHRHEGYDVVLVTQDLEKVEKQVRSLVEWTYVYKKVNFLGSLFSNAYLVYSFTGDDANGKPLATEKRMYHKKIFQCYQSYTSADMKELGIMAHANILRHPVFYGIPALFALFIYMFLYKSSYASGDVFGAKKMLAKKPSLSASEASRPLSAIPAAPLPVTPVPAITTPVVHDFRPVKLLDLPPLPAMPPKRLPIREMDDYPVPIIKPHPLPATRPTLKGSEEKPKHVVDSYIKSGENIYIKYSDRHKLERVPDGCRFDVDEMAVECPKANKS